VRLSTPSSSTEGSCSQEAPSRHSWCREGASCRGETPAAVCSDERGCLRPPPASSPHPPSSRLFLFSLEETAVNMIFWRSAFGAAPGARSAPGRGVQRRSKNVRAERRTWMSFAVFLLPLGCANAQTCAIISPRWFVFFCQWPTSGSVQIFMYICHARLCGRPAPFGWGLGRAPGGAVPRQIFHFSAGRRAQDHPPPSLSFLVLFLLLFFFFF